MQDFHTKPRHAPDNEPGILVGKHDAVTSQRQVTPPRTESPISDTRIDDDAKEHPIIEASLMSRLPELFEQNIAAKVVRTAVTHLVANGVNKDQLVNACAPFASDLLPNGFPEYVPQAGDSVGTWTLREHSFWTCGFFPGTLHGILERLTRFPEAHDIPQRSQLRHEVRRLCDLWAEPLHAMASRRDTHDVGFIVMPALQKDWELSGNTRSLDSIITAARSLASRYVTGAKAIRSWDARIQKNLQITCQCQNVLLIIDSMCNLDLLYYAASHVDEGGQELYDVATAHATKLLETHLRPERGTCDGVGYKGQWYSTYHVANVEPLTGEIKQQFTAQGYSKESTWARGQAWGILGYSQTYMSTRDTKFLDAACGLAEYFLYRLETGQHDEAGRYVPLWDFDAPLDDPPVRDSSAGAIAANGMLIISQALLSLGNDKLAARFCNGAVDIVRDLLRFALAPEKAAFDSTEVRDVVEGQTFEALMKHGTANYNEHAMKRYCDHGIVYGDYYLVEFGNRLLKMGLC